jgi:hypothetical protein
MTDGPAKKFYLIKEYGAFIRAAGLDPNKMSCAEIEATLVWIKAQFAVSIERVR